MAEKRQHQRIDCIEKCLLYHADSRYCAEIVNISISGALVQVHGFIPDRVLPGDACSFILGNDHAASFYRYKGRITRVNPIGVGLEILDYEFDSE